MTLLTNYGFSSYSILSDFGDEPSIEETYVENIKFTDSSIDNLKIVRFLVKYYGGMSEGLKLFSNVSNPTISPNTISLFDNSTAGVGSIVLNKNLTVPINYTGLVSQGFSGITSKTINPNISPILNVKIILPNFSWTWNSVFSAFLGGDSNFTLSDEALEFMCTNAPTVTGTTTLTLNSYCQSASYWKTFKATMESKGWTVA